ncbi:uncharacterized protein VP01_1075g1 [Puccinia sorghi]|uniref:Uncharacterized protein n=1 Tax=Puccinia sorghi TaxID=27349 RepID=A0A0L6VTH8_9BASI|nr:uncharacterized protein VP01_1075g1 [Puccinia sorghi]
MKKYESQKLIPEAEAILIKMKNYFHSAIKNPVYLCSALLNPWVKKSQLTSEAKKYIVKDKYAATKEQITSKNAFGAGEKRNELAVSWEKSHQMRLKRLDTSGASCEREIRVISGDETHTILLLKQPTNLFLNQIFLICFLMAEKKKKRESRIPTRRSWSLASRQLTLCRGLNPLIQDPAVLYLRSRVKDICLIILVVSIGKQAELARGLLKGKQGFYFSLCPRDRQIKYSRRASGEGSIYTLYQTQLLELKQTPDSFLPLNIAIPQYSTHYISRKNRNHAGRNLKF